MENAILEKHKKDKVEEILFFVMLLAIFSFIIGVVFYSAFGQSTFSDFAETLSFCIVKNPYTGEYGTPAIISIYPPAAYMPFYLFALICKTDIDRYLNAELTLEQLTKQPLFIFSFVLFFVICLAVVLFVASKLSKFKGKKLAYLLVCISCTTPILFCFVRANNIISVCALVLLFFYLYNGEKRYQRELANVCLAFAVGIKIYPALLILYFIKDRRFLDMLKTLAYSIVILFVPFFFVDGGWLKNIKAIYSNFKTFSGQGRELAYANIGFDSFATKLTVFLHLPMLQPILSKLFRFGSVVVTLVALCLAHNSKQKMQPILISVLTYILFQGVSYAYTLTMVFAPAIIYLTNFDELTKFNKWYYGICFLIIGFSFWVVQTFFIFPQIACMFLIVKGYIDLFKEYTQNRKLRHQPVAVKVEEEESSIASGDEAAAISQKASKENEAQVSVSKTEVKA